MDKRITTYLNIALVVLIVVSVVMLVKTFQRTFGTPPPQAPQAPAVVTPAPPPPPAMPQVREEPPGPVTQLSEIYRTHPQWDTGGNMAEAWSRVKPEEKARMMEELDKKIAVAKEQLVADPANKKAKHILFITETVKKLAENGFDYTRPIPTEAMTDEPVPEVVSGDNQ